MGMGTGRLRKTRMIVHLDGVKEALVLLVGPVPRLSLLALVGRILVSTTGSLCACLSTRRCLGARCRHGRLDLMRMVTSRKNSGLQDCLRFRVYIQVIPVWLIAMQVWVFRPEGYCMC
jgi:hypothetical protein